MASTATQSGQFRSQMDLFYVAIERGYILIPYAPVFGLLFNGFSGSSFVAQPRTRQCGEADPDEDLSIARSPLTSYSKTFQFLAS